MPTTTSEKLFLNYSIFFGVLAGFCISAILQAILVGSVPELLLTTREHADFLLFQTKTGHVQTYINLIIGGSLIYLLLLLPILNPYIQPALIKQPRKLLRLAVYLFAAIIITVGLFMRLDNFFGNMDQDIFMQIAGVSIPIVWWVMLGKTGIAGDFSTWKPAPEANIKTCILLAIFAYFIFIIITFIDRWAFLWFFTLVSEVFDHSGEVSMTGFTWLQYGFTALGICTSVILATTIIALAPNKQELHDQPRKLVLPVSLTACFSLFLYGGYYYGVSNYDLDQTSLSQAVHASETSDPSHTAILTESPIISEPWQTSIATYSIPVSSTIIVSEDNIRLLEQYLTDHPRSIHHYACEDAIVRSLFNLWKSKQATIRQQQTQSTVLQRIIFLNRLTCLPITETNRHFLNEYEDDSKWWVGSKAALLLAQAAIHFNEFSKAQHWLDVAKKQGENTQTHEEITIPKQPLLTTGTVSGSIKTQQPVTIGLFRIKGDHQEANLDTSYLSLNLVDSQTIPSSTAFNFTQLGKGRYFLALKYGGEQTEITMTPAEIFTLNAEQTSIDTGLITVKPTNLIHP